VKRLASVLAALALVAAAPPRPLDRIVAAAKFNGVVVAGDSDRPA
jgi:hypothetical protein